MFAARFCSFWDEFFNIPPAKIMQPDDTSGLCAGSQLSEMPRADGQLTR